MSSRKPIVHQRAWQSMFPQFFILGLLIIVFILFVKPPLLAICLGVVVYWAIHFFLEFCIPHNHKKGILLCKKGNYVEAIEEFKKSYNFFCRHSWIDKYRYLTLQSSSRASYTEMALINIAFCYTQSNNIKLAKESYQKVLDLFPDSEMAKSALNMISTYENKSDN